MGWWSYDVLGGDTPLDALGDIADFCGLGYNDKVSNNKCYYGYDFLKVKSRFENSQEMSKILDHIKQRTEGDSYYQEIYLQVLGLVLMSTGVKIESKLKQEILSAIENDSWAKEEEERKKAMDSFYKTFREYKKGSPVVLNQKGLFESFSEAMNR